MRRKAKQKYWVIRDTREQERGDGWWWEESDQCAGTKVDTLPTADYTLEGLPDNYFVIERKAGTAELAQNINQGRFERELERLEAFKYPFLIAECTWDDVYAFPERSGIPQSKWHELRVSNYYLAKRLLEFQFTYRTKIILAGLHARRVASCAFKRVIESLDGTP